MTDLPRVPGGFSILLCDPPWKFSSNSAARPGRNPRRHYPCMSLEEIEALPVRDIAAPAALLLMWITAPLSHHAGRVIQRWGFRPKSQVVWVKPAIGTGYWARNRHELLHIATRGRFPCPVPSLFPDSVIEAPRREHSRKPDEVVEIIDARFPDAARIELFARTTRPGWTAFGNEVGKF